MKVIRCQSLWSTAVCVLAVYTSTPVLAQVAPARKPLQAELEPPDLSKPTQPQRMPIVEIEPDPEEAGRLFKEGRKLMEQHREQEACPLLERSEQLTVALGTLLNLGLCHKRIGHLATAHEYYRQTEIMATRLGDDQRRELAHEQAAALEALRATLVLRFTSAPPRGLEVALDQVTQPDDIWQRPMYLDAGDHTVRVSAPNQRSWQSALRVQDGGQFVVVVPELQTTDGAAPVMQQTTPPAPPAVTQVSSVPRETVDRGSDPTTMHVLALAVGGAGLAALAVSIAFGLSARSSSDESNPICTPVCSDRGLTLRRDAHAAADRASVIGAVGGAAILGGIALWLLAPTAPALALHVDGKTVSAQYQARF